MLGAAKGVPEGAPAVIPRLFCRDPVAEIEFCTTALGAVEGVRRGDRTAWIVDPSGHVWTLATRIEETTEEERQARLARILATKTSDEA